MLIRITSSPTRTFSPSDRCFDFGWTVHQESSPELRKNSFKLYDSSPTAAITGETDHAAPVFKVQSIESNLKFSVIQH